MKLTRREFLADTAGAALAGGVLAGCDAQSNPAELTEPPEHPNILFIIVDDLGNRIGLLDDPHAQTPNLDALIQSGVTFTNQFVQTASCGPARTALFTGMYPDTTHAWHNLIDFRRSDRQPNAITLSQQYKDNGYQTVPIGKVFHLAIHDNEPRSWTHESWVPEGSLPRYYNPDTMGKPPTEVGVVSVENYVDWQIAQRAIFQINDFVGGESWFVAMGLLKPHLPFTAPEHSWNLYDPTVFQVDPFPQRPLNAPEINKNWEIGSFDGVPKFGPLSEEMARHLVHGHYACISLADEQIGRVVDFLDTTGLRESTLIVLWGDHGFHLGEQASWGKSMLFDTSLRSPFILNAPWLPPRRIDAMVEVVDIYPTLCELCNIPLPVGPEGRSLVPLIENPSIPFKTVTFQQTFRDFGSVADGNHSRIWGYSVRSERFRYSEWRKNDSTLHASELYDYLDEPLETANLVDEPAYRQVVLDHADLLNIMWEGAFQKDIMDEKWYTPLTDDYFEARGF